MSDFDWATSCKITRTIQLNGRQNFIQVRYTVVADTLSHTSHLNYMIFCTAAYKHTNSWWLGKMQLTSQVNFVYRTPHWKLVHNFLSNYIPNCHSNSIKSVLLFYCVEALSTPTKGLIVLWHCWLGVEKISKSQRFFSRRDLSEALINPQWTCKIKLAKQKSSICMVTSDM